MTRDTWRLRLLLICILVVTFLASALLYGISLESAQNWPELAHLRVPIYLVVVAGLVPVLIAIALVFEFLGVVDRGDAFSARTVVILGRLKLLIGVFAGYTALAFVGVWAAMRLMHPTLMFGWFAVEVAALFLLTVTALLERIFAAALALREDTELTV
ncbi:MAG TPA: DUF2975 domain-containing protein [Propionicimonas sp.]|jgi:hypothetical protein